jgi:hypothetical protein
MSSRPAAICVSGRSVSRTTCYLVARSAIARARLPREADVHSRERPLPHGPGRGLHVVILHTALTDGDRMT